MAEEFLFDDFFVDGNDPGVEHVMHLKGRDVPLRIKRSVSLGDREAAKSAATKTRINPQTGALSVEGFDEGALKIELLVRSIKSWPFHYKGGQPVPINRTTVGQLQLDAANEVDKLFNLLVGVAEVEKEALEDFEKASGEAFSPEAAADQTSHLAVSASE